MLSDSSDDKRRYLLSRSPALTERSGSQSVEAQHQADSQTGGIKSHRND
jgi:hypothetical protein